METRAYFFCPIVTTESSNPEVIHEKKVQSVSLVIFSIVMIQISDTNHKGYSLPGTFPPLEPKIHVSFSFQINELGIARVKKPSQCQEHISNNETVLKLMETS